MSRVEMRAGRATSTRAPSADSLTKENHGSAAILRSVPFRNLLRLSPCELRRSVCELRAGLLKSAQTHAHDPTANHVARPPLRPRLPRGRHPRLRPPRKLGPAGHLVLPHRHRDDRRLRRFDTNHRRRQGLHDRLRAARRLPRLRRPDLALRRRRQKHGVARGPPRLVHAASTTRCATRWPSCRRSSASCSESSSATFRTCRWARRATACGSTASTGALSR